MKTKVLFISVLTALLMSAFHCNAIIITGTVIDGTTGDPLIGACITEVGTTNGTTSDFDGNYSINVESEASELVFSYIGYLYQKIKIGNQKKINVILKEDVKELDQIVKIGYGVIKKEDVTSSISSCNLGYINPHSVLGVDQALQGKAAGVQVNSNIREQQEPSNTEGYTPIHENGFSEVHSNPLSTFSIDVDKAAYSNVRRYITNGGLPPVDAVRIEEMINYFNYDYPQPEGEKPFSINTELSVCPWNPSHYLLHVGLQGKNIDIDKLPASNIVFLLDVSGSMNSTEKLPLLKSSLTLLVKQLRPIDRVAIVVYAGSSGLVLPSTSCDNKEAIINSLDVLQAGGSTAGGAGLMLAYKVAEENFIKGGNNRIILATDGDFNVGASSNAEMERLIETEREKGIAISVLGFGMGDYQDDKMEIIADKGNGNYSYIDNLMEAKKVLVNEFGGTLFTIAKDVKFQLEFNPYFVSKYRLIGYENRLLNTEDFDNDKKDAGEMGAGHTVTALYEIIPVNKKDSVKGLKYQTSALTAEATQSNDLITMKLRYKEPTEKVSLLIEQSVKNELTQLENTSNNFRFSAAVAEFGMLLRDSQHKGTASFESALELALNAKGQDKEGYRNEFVNLIRIAGFQKGINLKE
ncbi:MAG: von Willebrand factor type A domain-containing protein [Bacteroidales bacterium]|nr:von Willebrand factor type A domain-containing protein [Bacteroidales bacterium]